ncbi:MAG TPA: shikimate kinase [Gemmatimonadales bacterium]|nr:shikimate kinase [Gemmatimonadales bacterium]
MKRHIVLVGLPGSGKTTVGRILARELEARFVDIDAVVAQDAAMPIERIFAERGEAAFRRLERAAVERELSADPGVVAPGGGWAAQPGNLEAARNTVSVYLSVTPEEAESRIKGEEALVRPLLASGDLLQTLRRLLADREPFYRQCTAMVDTVGKAPQAVAQAVSRLARSLGGW